MLIFFNLEIPIDFIYVSPKPRQNDLKNPEYNW